MARLSEKSLLAVAAVVDVALHARGQPVAAKSLAERHGLPPRHLEPVLQALVHAGILKGVRGPRGGYELARERRRISVAEIVGIAEAAEEDPRRKVPPLVNKYYLLDLQPSPRRNAASRRRSATSPSTSSVRMPRGRA